MTPPSISRRAVLAVALSGGALVVLASCAPATRPRPDYAQELNSLIQRANEGERIVLPPGASSVRSTIRLRSGVDLHAHPDGSTLELEDGADFPFVLANRVEGVQISGIRFDGGSQSREAVSIQLDGCSRVSVVGCELVRMKHAVHVYSSEGVSSDISVTSCVFDEIVDFAIRIDAEVEGAHLVGNTIRSVSKGEAASPSALYIRGQRVAARDNTVLSSYDTGIMVAGGSARDVEVVGNVLSTDMVGIYFGNGAESGTIRGNRITSARDFGVHVHDRGGETSDVRLVDNSIGPTGKSGVQIEGVRRVEVQRNTIVDPASDSADPEYWRCGVAITALRDHGSRSVLIEANEISSEHDGMAHGVLVMTGTSNIIVEGNSVSGARHAAYEVEAGGEGPYLIERSDGSVLERKGVTRRW